MKSRLRHASSLPAPAPAHAEDRRARHTYRTHFKLPRLRLTRPKETAVRLGLRTAAALVFFTLGYIKFFHSIHLGTDAVVLPNGPEGFAQYLAAIGVPFPLFNAYMVCWVEMICGAGLVLSAFLPAPALLTRLAALPLVGDMTVALATVGIPNLLGHPVLLQGVAVTTQPWRLPLEFAVFLIALWLLWRPLAQARQPGPAFQEPASAAS